MQVNQTFYKAVQETAAAFSASKPIQVVLFHHNDCDGLSAGAILSKAFERRHLKILRYCLEKPYPKVLAEIFDNPLLDKNCVFVFTDFASGMLSILCQLNKKAMPIFVIDHHQIESNWQTKAENSNVINLLNCRNLGVDGSLECSASSLAYQFAISLDSTNSDLVALGLLGAIGDGQYLAPFEFKGHNLLVFQQAKDLGFVDDEGHFKNASPLSAIEYMAAINALGSFAYLKKGPDIAMKGLAEGFDSRYQELAKQAQLAFNTNYEAFVANLNLLNCGKVQYFYLGNNFANYGVKTVGLVCERLIAETQADPSKVLAGFQKIPNQIPGVGNIEFDEYKVSLRMSQQLRQLLTKQPELGFDRVLPNVIEQIGGFIDACHPHAAAVTIKLEQAEQLINNLNAYY